jgi:hypothetical protein
MSDDVIHIRTPEETIGGARIGDEIVIELTTNRRITAELHSFGIIGVEVKVWGRLAKKELKFYPFSNIVSLYKEFQ